MQWNWFRGFWVEKKNKDNSFFDFSSNQPAWVNHIFESSKNSSKQGLRASNNNPINDPIATTTVAVSGSGSVLAGSRSFFSSSMIDPHAEKQKSYAFSRQFLEWHKKVKSGEESFVDKMISMMGMQMQQDFAMC